VEDTKRRCNEYRYRPEHQQRNDGHDVSPEEFTLGRALNRSSRKPRVGQGFICKRDWNRRNGARNRNSCGSWHRCGHSRSSGSTLTSRCTGASAWLKDSRRCLVVRARVSAITPALSMVRDVAPRAQHCLIARRNSLAALGAGCSRPLRGRSRWSQRNRRGRITHRIDLDGTTMSGDRRWPNQWATNSSISRTRTRILTQRTVPESV
jgi:hypothetical protein